MKQTNHYSISYWEFGYLQPNESLTNKHCWTFLVVQWVGIHLLVQGTQVLSLFQGDATRHAATKPLCHNY